ncbi:relaxase/mobilization nuclease domain-containing protein [Collinsella aerofaciens]|uniref:relaxase/mobilization nuclease domain-containing protein n=1 Tax=Collinsella aerofaciens TaxID=74426 RepID=UPI00189D19A6|nr:relaxase/mobilization nuclease domain-containing protein [Collinsella aerofaciens]MDB1890266.1 relaxase/mobilization nuclease domain-containing protein [Collinsella aerofaciens]
MTVIKQKSVSSERYAKNVRRYINGKHALARDGWNIKCDKYWFSKMAMTRKVFHHDTPSRAGAKNVTILHQILAFLPEECSCNGGKMTPDACMAYARQWVAKHYPNQQVIFALHEESDKAGKRYAVHMAINRTDLLAGKRCETGGRHGKFERALWVRELDKDWNLAQLEKGKKNSKIRDRQPRDTEKEIIGRGEYSYKNNLRELIHIAIDEGRVKNMEQFKKLLASWGVDIFIKNNRVYATDLDIKEAGNPKCTFNLTRLDGRFALKSLQTAFENNVLEAERALPYEKRCEIYIRRLKKAYSAWVEQAKASKGVAYNSFPKFITPKCDEDLLEDPAVRDELLARRGYAREIRNRYAGAVPNAGDDRVRTAGQAHGGSTVSRQMGDRVIDRGDFSRGDTPR